MKTTLFDIVVVGELNPDLILSGDTIPEFGQVEKLVDQATLTIGSSSAIFACGAARLGLRVAFIGKVGKDLFGDFMRQSLEDHEIDTKGITVDAEHPTGISVILTKGTDRAILTFPGTIPLLNYADINLGIMRQARHLHLASYFIQAGLRDGLPNLFTITHKSGLSISLDTNYDPHGRWDGVDSLLSQVDLFLPNETEILGITKAKNIEEAINQLAARVPHLGIKLGSAGAIYCHNDQQYQEKPLEVEVVDTVGAGDTFDAGFVYGYLARWKPERIIKFATICASLSTRQAGGTAAQPTLAEALSYL